MVEWYDRLRQVWPSKFKSVAEFSRVSGISTESLHKYLNGDVKSPRGNTLEILARALDVDLLWLKEGIVVKKDDVAFRTLKNQHTELLQLIVAIAIDLNTTSTYSKEDIIRSAGKIYSTYYDQPPTEAEMQRVFKTVLEALS